MPQSTRPPQAVVFDLWRTLVDPGGPRFCERIAAIVSEDGGCPTTGDDITERFFSMGCRVAPVPTLGVLEAVWRDACGGEVPQAAVDRYHAEFREFVEGVVWVDGAVEVLVRLGENGVRTAVVSNCTLISCDVVARLGIEAKTDAVHLSCLTGFAKPDPRAFAFVTDEWGVAPTDVVVVGDKMSTDIVGAQSLGMRSIWLNRKTQDDTVPDSVQPDRVLHTLAGCEDVCLELLAE